MSPSANFSVHQVIHKTIENPATTTYADEAAGDPHNLWVYYDHPRVLTLDKVTGTANIYEISPDGKEPRLVATIENVPGTPPGHPFVKLTQDYVIFWIGITLSSTALCIFDIRTGEEIGSQIIEGGRTRQQILYEDGKLVLWLEDPESAVQEKVDPGRSKNYLAVFEFDKGEGEFVHVSNYWPPKENITESTYDGPLVPLHLSKSNEVIAMHCKHPSGTTHLVKWPLSDTSGTAIPQQSYHDSTRDESYETNAIDHAAHIIIPSTGAIILSHSQFRLDEPDFNPVYAVRSIDSSTLRENWAASVEHGVEDIQYDATSDRVIVTSGQHVGGVTVLEGKSGKILRTEKLKETGDLKFVGASPDGADIVLYYDTRKVQVVPVVDFIRNGISAASTFELPKNVLESTSDETSWVREMTVGPKTLILVQATTANFAVVQWGANGSAAGAA